jgi:hypothetical protein
MTLLTMIARVCNAPGVGLPVPAQVVGSADAGVLELLELANQEGEELARRADWPVLIAEQVFTTAATAAQAGALPADFQRFVNGTWFNRTTARKLVGPLTPEQWQRLQANGPSGGLGAGVATQAFRRRGLSLLIAPTPPAGQSIAFEYLSKNWCRSSGGTGQAAWVADSDSGVLEERLMALGIIWRWRKAKGFSFSDALDTYQEEVEKEAARAPGAPALSLTARPVGALGVANIQEGSW